MQATETSVYVLSQAAAQYVGNKNYFFAVAPPAGHFASVRFSSFSTEANYDWVTVFNTPTAASFQVTGTRPTTNLASTNCSGAVGTVCAPCAGAACSTTALYSGLYATTVVVQLFSDATGLSSGVLFQVILAACPLGSYCPAGTGNTVSQLCAAGSYGGTVGQTVATSEQLPRHARFSRPALALPRANDRALLQTCSDEIC